MQIYISIVARDIINLSIGKLGSKESTCNAGDMGLILGLGRSPGGDHGNSIPLFLPGESPWTEETGRLLPTGSQNVGHD